MSVDKGIFRPYRQIRPETFDFHSGNQPIPHWKSDEQIDRYVPTHCCYCGVQCGMYLKVANGQVVGVEPREDFPLNHGMLCPKGGTAYQTVNHPDRLTYPMMRRHGKLQKRVTVTRVGRKSGKKSADNRWICQLATAVRRPCSIDVQFS